MKLAHLHLPHITSFSRVSHLQQLLTSRLLAYKKASSALRDGSRTTTPRDTYTYANTNTNTSRSTSTNPIELSPPDPTIITFTPNPVYTTGRRDLPPSNTAPSSSSSTTAASSPTTDSPSVLLSLPPSLEPIRSILCPPGTWSRQLQHDPSSKSTDTSNAIAEYHPTLRGGQTTYHGPGQMVAYTILDLHRLVLTPRCHIRLLENSAIDVLKSYGVDGFVTEDPGVWVNSPPPPPESASTPQTSSSTSTTTAGDVVGLPPPRKITAVGVHLRRNISSYGIGFNVTNEPMWFFRQIVACGLEGRDATSLEAQGVPVDNGATVDEVARRFVEAFVKRVNEGVLACTTTTSSAAAASRAKGGERERIEEVYEIREEDVLNLEKW